MPTADDITSDHSKSLYASCCVSWDLPAQLPRATALAQALGLPLISQQALPAEGYTLWVTAERLFIELRQAKHKHRLFAEFLTGAMGYRLEKGGGLRQALAKAVGLKNRTQGCSVLDGTAGLGKDAFILAMLGANMCLVERSKVMFALLQDGLKRAENNEKIGEKVKANIHLVAADFREYLKNLSSENFPEVIYLDPMFPESKKSALTKMEMRIIRDIVGSDEDAEALLADSLKVATKRVVVKRPLHAPYLQAIEPSFIVSGKRNRYDVYLTGGNIKIHE